MIRKAFLSGEFERVLRRLNPFLHIYCGDEDHRPAGLFLVKDGQVEELGGVDKNMIPDQSLVALDGKVIKKGWRAVLTMLLARRLIKAGDVRRVVPQFFSKVRPFAHEFQKREIDEAVDYFRQKRPIGRNGNPVYTRKDLMEIGDAFKK